MKINANGTEITVLGNINEDDYISLTDIARYKNPDEPKDVIKNWMRSRSTLEFLGLWEQLNNPNFKGVDFDPFIKDAGSNSFTMSPQRWIKTLNAIGIISRVGKNGGTFAHSDIAFEFASWVSPEFKLYIIKDYQRLKTEEAEKKALGWDAKRELSKVNYRIHTDAIKDILIAPELSRAEIGITYATEADVLNVALFGKTAKQWRIETNEKRKNMRDFATVEELIVLTNLEGMNAELIKQGLDQHARLQILRRIAYEQLQSVSKSSATKRLKKRDTRKL
ncbi:MAG: KilA-N domain-containing protein [Anaerostipes sp.]|nr:KilA-N domain-containing protein [Anaerostipes sp.]